MPSRTADRYLCCKGKQMNKWSSTSNIDQLDAMNTVLSPWCKINENGWKHLYTSLCRYSLPMPASNLCVRSQFCSIPCVALLVLWQLVFPTWFAHLILVKWEVKHLLTSLDGGGRNMADRRVVARWCAWVRHTRFLVRASIKQKQSVCFCISLDWPEVWISKSAKPHWRTPVYMSSSHWPLQVAIRGNSLNC